MELLYLCFVTSRLSRPEQSSEGLSFILFQVLFTFLLVDKSFLPSFLPFSLSLSFLQLHPQHMEVPRPGVELELQLPGCTTATATRDPSCVFDLHHSSQQCWLLHPLSEARH